MTMKKMDQDKDGRVSFSDFIESVKKVCKSSNEPEHYHHKHQEPLMMEAFGTCLPRGKVGQQFLKKILDEDSYQHQENNIY